MIRRLAATLLIVSAAALTRADDATVDSPKIRAKTTGAVSSRSATAADGSSPANDAGLQPDTDVIDAPTSSVLDYGGYSSRSRFYSQGGLLEYISFGVYPGLNLGASAAVDGLIGNESQVRVRAPSAQVRYRFFDGDASLPSLAAGYDGQGYLYNSSSERFNERQRGFYIVGSKEIGTPGLQIHPSINISDFNSNSIYGALPLTLNIRDKAEMLAEWDNIADFSHSRVNLGLRAFLTPSFEVDFGVRSIGSGGYFSDGQRRGPERVVQLKYAGNF